MTVHTRPIDVEDTDAFHRFYTLLREAELFERVEAPYWSERGGQIMFSRDDPAEAMTAYGAFDGETLVAAGFTAFSLLDNLEKAFVQVAVAPSLRRRGLGSAMLSDLVEISRGAGRSAILMASYLQLGERRTHPHRGFAEKNAFALANVEVRRTLLLPVTMDQLDAWTAEVAAHHGGYTIETFVDDIPEGLLQSYCDVMNQLALDAPTGDIEMEAEALTPEAYRKRHAITKEMGMTMFVTLALDAQGQTVAYTTMAVPEDDPPHIYQWGTLVQRDHRGHRLGMTVKIANLAAVQSACPERTLIHTQNAEANGPMIDINERMGFRRVEEMAEFQRLVTV